MSSNTRSTNNTGGLTAQSTVTGKQEYLKSINGALLASTEGGGLPSTFTTGQVKIAVTGTAVQLSGTSVPLLNGVIIIANQNNTASITIGGSGVTNTVDGTGNGTVVTANSAVSIAVSDLDVLYVNGTAGDWITWIGS